jgi:phage major head subunit gpT-like protein
MALKEKGYIIANERFEVTVGIPRKKIELDTYGLYRPVIAGMGASARLHPDELVFPLLTNGFTNKGYDGKAFFASDHEFGGNYGTASLTLSDGSPNVAAYRAAIASIGRVKDDQRKPLFTSAAKKLTLVVPPELEEVANHLLHDDFLSVTLGSTQNNVWKNSATPLMSPQLTNATAWFILVEFMGLRPIIFQQQQAPAFVVKNTAQDSDHVFMQDEFLYGADSFDNAGYSLPQLAYGSTGTVVPAPELGG